MRSGDGDERLDRGACPQREKLVEQLSKAETEEDEWAVLVVSAKKDTTKVREAARGAPRRRRSQGLARVTVFFSFL